MDNRKKILRDLIECRGDPSELAGRLSQFSWDSNEALIKLELTHVVRVLQYYIDGKISKDQIEDWANALEVRDDVEFDEVSKDLISILANPELQRHKLSVNWAKEIISKYGL
jgi:Glu-tRNA(Gln) amidotransferase subunit E-like FAD-binding protein